MSADIGWITDHLVVGCCNKIPFDVCLPIQYGKVSCRNYTLSLDMTSLKQHSSMNYI